jgi:hypothetical protein
VKTVGLRLSALIRQVVTGLVILAVLALSAGQALAHTGNSGDAGLNAAPYERVAAGAPHDHGGLPCEHHDGLPCNCFAGDCSMFVTVLPASTPAAFIAPREITLAFDVNLPPEGRGLLPDVPPPRSLL